MSSQQLVKLGSPESMLSAVVKGGNCDGGCMTELGALVHGG